MADCSENSFLKQQFAALLLLLEIFCWFFACFCVVREPDMADCA